MLEGLKFDKTLAALFKIKSDFKRFSIVSDIVLQIIFIILYGYSIYTNLSNTFLLVIYSILLGLGILYFIFTLYTLNKAINKHIKKNIQRGYRYSKLFIRLFTVGLSVYELLNYETTDLNKILTAITVISFVLQIGIEIARVLIDRYIDLIVTGFRMDVEELKQSKIGKAVDAIAHPKESIIDVLNGKLNKENNVINPSTNTPKSKNMEILENIASKRAEEKKINQNNRDETLNEKIDELKNNIGKFFRK